MHICAGVLSGCFEYFCAAFKRELVAIYTDLQLKGRTENQISGATHSWTNHTTACIVTSANIENIILSSCIWWHNDGPQTSCIVCIIWIDHDSGFAISCSPLSLQTIDGVMPLTSTSITGIFRCQHRNTNNGTHRWYLPMPLDINWYHVESIRMLSGLLWTS